MTLYKIALLGFGNVGKAFVKLLIDKSDDLQRYYGISFVITGIATKRHGIAICNEGIDPSSALDAEDLYPLSDNPNIRDAKEWIQHCEADVLFEISPVNYHDGQPAIQHIELALQKGMHAITANKGPVVFGYNSLVSLANRMNRKFYFESTVMDGAPIFSLFRNALPAAKVYSFQGILNSTTNMILSRMENGESFDAAVKYCQRIGIAETDPSGDVDGWDAAIKVAALTTVLMGVPLFPNQVERVGIRDISQEDLMLAKEENKRWKLVCSSSLDGDRVRTKVAPQMVTIDSPLYSINGTTSIIQIQTDVLGKLSIIEEDPGPHTTAYGLLADFINAVNST